MNIFLPDRPFVKTEATASNKKRETMSEK